MTTIKTIIARKVPLVSVHDSIAETSALTKQSMVRFGRYNHGLLRQALKGLPRNDGIGGNA